MTTVSIIVIMAILWAAITGSYEGINLLFGAVIGLVAVLLLRNTLVSPGTARRTGKIIKLAFVFLYELMASAIKVAKLVLSPNMKAHLRPAIVAVPLTVKSDAEITLLANMVTLTPGTLSVDVSEDGKVLYVHTLQLSSKQALIAEINGGFEKQVKEVFK